MALKIESHIVESDFPAFTSLGCYTIHYYSMEHHGPVLLCAKCAKEEYVKVMAELAEEDGFSETTEILSEIYWEGPVETCEGCQAQIESAYGDPDA